MNWRRLVLWGILLLALLGGLTYAFRPQPILVDLAPAVSGPLVVTLDEEGDTRVRDVFVLSAPVTGRLLRIALEVGDAVVAGQTIVARIEPADPAFLDLRSESEAQAAVQAAEAAEALAQARLEEAEAELEFAEAELKRAKQLIRNDTISQRQLDEAQRAFKTRRAALTTAEASLRMRNFELAQAHARLVSPVETQELHGTCACVSITAPVDGRVLRLLEESTRVVQAGEPLLEIGDPAQLEIVADYLSEEAVRIEPGQRAIVEDWGGGAPLAGVVRRVEPTGFTKVSALGIEEQRVNVLLDLTDPPARWTRLGHGYRVEVRVVLWEAEEVLKVPLTALFRNGEEWALFVAEAGRARRRGVQLGQRTGLEAEIRAGLAASELVVLQPSEMIVEGARLAPRN